ncbi:hypothetical protein GDO81_028202, partial [Engystomops pustulosus]
RKDRPISLGIFPLSPGDSLVLPDPSGAETPGNGPWKLQDQNHARCNTSLKEELYTIAPPGAKTTGPGAKTTGPDPNNMVIAAPKDPKEEEEVIMKANLKNNNVPKNEDVQEISSAPTDTNDNEERSEVQSIIESTPELDMDKERAYHMT